MAPVDGEIVSIEKMYQNFLTIFVSTPVVSCEMLLLLSLTRTTTASAAASASSFDHLSLPFSSPSPLACHHFCRSLATDRQMNELIVAQTIVLSISSSICLCVCL
jgi:hypothetical protein